MLEPQKIRISSIDFQDMLALCEKAFALHILHDIISSHLV